MRKNIVITVLGLILMICFSFMIFGDTEAGFYSIARVKAIEPIPSEDVDIIDKMYAVELEHLSGARAGEVTVIDHFETPNSVYNIELEKGDKVLTVVEQQEEQLIVGIDEHFKSRKIFALIVIMLLVITGISGVNGVKAMLALFFTLIMIFGVMAHFLLNGAAPTMLTAVCSAIIILVSIVIIAGFTKKAMIAAIGTYSGVILAGLFGWLTIAFLKLSGYSGSESTYLQMMDANIDLRGLLISGIIIGSLGAVMDVAISIASALQELIIANPSYTSRDLFKSGMNIGRDIIGSMVNTLILAYTGASLTLILVFAMQKDDFPLLKVMNMEFICTEIVRSLAGLFGMVLSIPVTATVASIIYLRGSKKVV
jgi:uncharacterized membrane protein